jgi:hypothetical protein
VKNIKKNNSVPKVTSVTPKKQKISKDELLNTPKDLGNEIKIMPYDESTLKTFRFKEMNFKDMTGYQKTILVAVCILFLSIFILFILPTLSNIFGGVNIGNFNLFNNTEEETTETDSYAYEGDYITLGENISVTVGDIKFDNFTKSSDYKLIFNYLPKEDMQEVVNKKIYIEVYSNSKSLLSRFLFDPEKDLTGNENGIYSVKLSSNNFNKAQYVVVRVITNVLEEELPEDQIDDNAAGTDDGTDDGTGTDNGNTGTTVDKNKLVCYYNSVDGSLKIYKELNATFNTDKIVTYKINYTITSLIETLPKNYATYYKTMMTLYKTLMASPGCEPYIKDNGLNASLVYTVTLSEYKDIKIIEEYIDLYDEEYLAQKTPYQLEIEKESTKTQATTELENTEWICD